MGVRVVGHPFFVFNGILRKKKDFAKSFFFLKVLPALPQAERTVFNGARKFTIFSLH
ncbi:MAG: hypothetical protein ACI9XO_004108 [Paraglaciecola sp.]|jgi:hypothetical protein